MVTEEKNFDAMLNLKMLAANKILTEAIGLNGKAIGFTKELRRNIPSRNNNWSEEGLDQFMIRFRESILSPIRHLNRESLEKIGISTKSVAESIFDSTGEIEEIKILLKKIKDFNESIFEMLVKKDIAHGWLRMFELNEIVQNLKAIIQAQSSLNRIFGSRIPLDLKDDLLRHCLDQIHFVKEAEAITILSETIQDTGITLEPHADLTQFHASLSEANEKIEKLQGEYGVTIDELKNFLKSEDLVKANTILETKSQEVEKKKRALMKQWSAYSSILKYFAEEIPPVPKRLSGLEEGVKKLTSQVEKTIEDGLPLLNFIRGEAQFPDNIPLKNLKKTLIAIQPLLLKAFSGDNDIDE